MQQMIDHSGFGLTNNNNNKRLDKRPDKRPLTLKTGYIEEHASNRRAPSSVLREARGELAAKAATMEEAAIAAGEMPVGRPLPTPARSAGVDLMRAFACCALTSAPSITYLHRANVANRLQKKMPNRTRA